MPLRLHPDVTTADTDDGTVLLHMSTGRYFQLNTTGAHVLQRLLDGHSPEQVAGEMATRHEIDVRQVEHDVAGVIDHMRASGLVV